jgi:hypothetical protein
VQPYSYQPIPTQKTAAHNHDFIYLGSVLTFARPIFAQIVQIVGFLKFSLIKTFYEFLLNTMHARIHAYRVFLYFIITDFWNVRQQID